MSRQRPDARGPASGDHEAAAPGDGRAPVAGPGSGRGAAASARDGSRDDGPPVRRGALVLMGGTLASRVTGLVRNSLLNQLFDRTITDAFAVALRVPNLFRELLAEGALTNSFIPVYKRLGGEEQRRFSGALLGLLVLVNGLLVLAAVLAAPWVVHLLLGADGSVDFDLAVRLTRAVFPFLAAISLSAWAMGVLNAEERFFGPAWAPVMLNLVAAALMLAFPDRALPLAWAFLAGGAAQFAFQLPFLARAGLLPSWHRLWHPQLGAVLILMVPFAVTTSGRQFVNVVATRILNTLPAGSQTAYFNAELFLSMAVGLFAISPALAYYSRLSHQAVHAPEAFRGTLEEGVRFVVFLCAPAGLLLAALAEPAVRVVFDWLSLAGRGLDDARLMLTVAATAPLGFAVLPLGLHQLLIRSYYVRQRVRTPIAVTVAFLGLQALLFTLLAPRIGIAGLTWAAAIAAWLQLALMTRLLRRDEGLRLPSLLGHGARVLLAAALAAGAARLAAGAVPAPDWFGWLARLAVGGGAGVAAYLLAALAVGLPELRRVRDRLRRATRD